MRAEGKEASLAEPRHTHWCSTQAQHFTRVKCDCWCHASSLLERVKWGLADDDDRRNSYQNLLAIIEAHEAAEAKREKEWAERIKKTLDCDYFCGSCWIDPKVLRAEIDPKGGKT